MSKQYAYSFDNEYFGPCVFDSKEEALADARKEAKENQAITDGLSFPGT